MADWMSLLAWGDSGWGDEMIRGAGWTLLVAVIAFALGIVVGIAGAAVKLSQVPFVPLLGDVYTTLVRGVPDLITIYIIFFGGGQAAMAVARLFGHTGYIEFDALTTGVLALGFISGAYATEVIRGAVMAVPKGQIEAAKACGMNRRTMFRRILVPQVARYALPGLGNVWQLTLKDTSLISVVGLTEIMRQAFVASGSTKQPIVFFVSAAVLYLALTSLSNKVFDRVEIVANRGVRRA
ncbi:MAG: ABC transporter permease [Thalassobaculaceae bacterium]|nr:ABC transporter permease [Thalassobaculaceae bacterium]